MTTEEFQHSLQGESVKRKQVSCLNSTLSRIRHHMNGTPQHSESEGTFPPFFLYYALHFCDLTVCVLTHFSVSVVVPLADMH